MSERIKIDPVVVQLLPVKMKGSPPAGKVQMDPSQTDPGTPDNSAEVTGSTDTVHLMGAEMKFGCHQNYFAI